MKDPIGRPVRIVSICFREGTRSLSEIATIVDREAARGCDLMILPETWLGTTPEPLDGPAVTTLRALAHHAPVQRTGDGFHK